MTGNTPTDHGRGEALVWAESLREVRSEVCASLGECRITLDDVLDRRTDPRVGAVHLLSVLEALPGARKVDTRRALAKVGLPERVPIASLGAAQVDLVRETFTTVPGAGSSG